MADVFTNVSCTILANNCRNITWSLKPDGDYPEDAVLQLEYSRNGGPWEVIADDLSGTCAYYDNRVRNYNKYANDCYRLRLTSKSDPEINVVSDICPAGRNQAYPYSAEAANALTQIQKTLRLTGREGVLLKRKEWGPRCPLCTDFDNEEGVNEHCPRCLGTGIDGGYYNGITLPIQVDQEQQAQTLTRNGTVQDDVLTARCIAFPWIALGDVWCETATNYRFYIQNATVISSYKHIPLVYQLTMRRLEYTDVMYRPDILADDMFVTYTPGATARVIYKDMWQSGDEAYNAQPEVPPNVDHSSSTQDSTDVSESYTWARALKGGN